MTTIQFTAYPLTVNPELGAKFELTGTGLEALKQAAREQADRIAARHGWLDRGIAVWCVTDSHGLTDAEWSELLAMQK